MAEPLFVKQRIEQSIGLALNFIILLLSGLLVYHNVEQMLCKTNPFAELFIGRDFVRILDNWSIFKGFVLFVALFGINAVLAVEKGNTTLIKWYGVLTFFAFLLNAASDGTMVASIYSNFDDIQPKINELLLNESNNIRVSPTIYDIVNELQCCVHPEGFVPTNTKCDLYNVRDCKDRIEISMFGVGFFILIISSSLSILLLLALVTTVCLIQRIDKEKCCFE